MSYRLQKELEKRNDPVSLLVNNMTEHSEVWDVKSAGSCSWREQILKLNTYLIWWIAWNESVCQRRGLNTDASFLTQDHISSSSGCESFRGLSWSVRVVCWQNQAGDKTELYTMERVPLVNDSRISHAWLGLSQRYWRKWRACVLLSPAEADWQQWASNMFDTVDGKESFYLMHNKSL